SGYAPNRKLADGGIEGLPCVEFSMRFFDAPRLHVMVSHQISVQRIGNTSFTVRHLFSGEGRSFAEVLDTRVWAVHGEQGLRKRQYPSSDGLVIEQNPQDVTFGFGVVLSAQGHQFLAGDDPELVRAISGGLESWEDIEIRIGGERIRIDGIGFTAIGRINLLR